MNDNVISTIISYMQDDTFEKFQHQQSLTLQHIYVQNYIKFYEGKLLDKLNYYFYWMGMNHYEEFIQLLIKSKAIIAGGFVLSAYSRTNTSDLDVYVELNKADSLIKYFEKLGYELKKMYMIKNSKN